MNYKCKTKNLTKISEYQSYNKLKTPKKQYNKQYADRGISHMFPRMERITTNHCIYIDCISMLQ